MRARSTTDLERGQGLVTCSGCGKCLAKSQYPPRQLKEKGERRCRNCSSRVTSEWPNPGEPAGDPDPATLARAQLVDDEPQPLVSPDDEAASRPKSIGRRQTIQFTRYSSPGRSPRVSSPNRPLAVPASSSSRRSLTRQLSGKNNSPTPTPLRSPSDDPEPKSPTTSPITLSLSISAPPNLNEEHLLVPTTVISGLSHPIPHDHPPTPVSKMQSPSAPRHLTPTPKQIVAQIRPPDAGESYEHVLISLSVAVTGLVILTESFIYASCPQTAESKLAVFELVLFVSLVLNSARLVLSVVWLTLHAFQSTLTSVGSGLLHTATVFAILCVSAFDLSIFCTIAISGDIPDIVDKRFLVYLVLGTGAPVVVVVIARVSEYFRSPVTHVQLDDEA
eukprot:c6716_g1_i1.p1 GENE.c6716_g1_i1~~c6716_g1_i1.p1  ORF type:complete len:390 (+),score=72.47 c6716_g1_i1:121-1290(+)